MLGRIADELTDTAALGFERRTSMISSRAVGEYRACAYRRLDLFSIQIRSFIAAVNRWPVHFIFVVLP